MHHEHHLRMTVVPGLVSILHRLVTITMQHHLDTILHLLVVTMTVVLVSILHRLLLVTILHHLVLHRLVTVLHHLAAHLVRQQRKLHQHIKR